MTTHRVIDLEKLNQMIRKEGLPTWITDWKTKVERYTQNLEAACAEGRVSNAEMQKYGDIIVKMMRRTDRLFQMWYEDFPFKTWAQLSQERPPEADDIYAATVLDTEDYVNGIGVPSFVLFLDKQWPGFLKEFTTTCLRECDPLLEEYVQLTPEQKRQLTHPVVGFKTNSAEVLQERISELIRSLMPRQAPEYAQRVLIANGLTAQGKLTEALTELEFARCEAVEPRFAYYIQSGDNRATVLLEQTQHWQISVLLQLWPSL